MQLGDVGQQHNAANANTHVLKQQRQPFKRLGEANAAAQLVAMWLGIPDLGQVANPQLQQDIH